MVIVAGKSVDSQGIAGFLMGLKPDIVSMYLQCDKIQTRKEGYGRQNYDSGKTLGVREAPTGIIGRGNEFYRVS